MRSGLLRLAIGMSILCAGASLFAQDSSRASENAPRQQPTQTEPLQISSSDMKKLFIKKVRPAYSPLAQQARISGKVVVRLVISEDGSPRDIHLVSGHPMIAPAAIEAAQRSKYRPYLVDGKPVAVEGEVEYDIP